MDAQADEPRTEDPTALKLARARQRGQVALSPGLTLSAGLAGALSFGFGLGDRLASALRGLLSSALAQAARAEGLAFAWAPLRADLLEISLLLGVLLVCIAVPMGLVGLLQVGPAFSFAALGPDAARASLSARLRDALSPARGARGVLSLLQLAILLGATLLVVGPSLPGVLSLSLSTAEAASRGLYGLVVRLLVTLAVAGGLVGGADYVMRRMRLRAALRMGRRELRQEHKQSYGDPELRAERRRKYAELSTLLDLSRARLLITGGQGQAVALAHDPSDPSSGAPWVFARARGVFAERMCLRARELGLQVAPSPIAAALEQMPVGQRIPPEHYSAVAQLMQAQAGAPARAESARP